MNQEMLSAVRDGTAANWNFEGKLRDYFLLARAGGRNPIELEGVCYG